MQVSQIELYNILQKKFGASEAESLLKFVESEVNDKFSEQKDVLSTKQDLAKLETALRVELRDNKIDTIKWIVGMSIIQTATLIAGLIAIVKFIQPTP